MIFWKMLLAHFVTDFVLQPDSLAENKGKLKVLLIHCLIFFILATLSLLPVFSYRSVTALGLLSAFHGIIDYLKDVLQRRKGRDFWPYFVGDQALHLLGIGVVFLFLRETGYPWIVETVHRYWLNPSLFMVSAFFVSIIFGGSYFIGIVCKGFLDPLDIKRRPGIERAGRYLGMIERSLILTAVLIGKIEFVGYIFAAKSIARYPEMKEESHFAEYYLVGTLTSISLAFFGGLLLKHFLGW